MGLTRGRLNYVFYGPPSDKKKDEAPVLKSNYTWVRTSLAMHEKIYFVSVGFKIKIVGRPTYGITSFEMK